jgi:hypothetical protein
MMSVECTDEEKVRIRAVPVTPSGNAAQLDGPLSVMRVGGDATAEMDAGDPLAFWLISGPAPGVSTFQVSADADLGEGVVTIADIVELRVAGAKASSLGLVAEAPVPK